MQEKCYLDSNILVYFSDRGSKFHSRSKNIIMDITDKEWGFSISSLCIDEFLYVMKTALSKKYKEKQVWSILRETLQAILQLPNLEIINAHTDVAAHMEVIELMKNFNLSPRDAYHIFMAFTNQINHFITFDKDFRKTAIKNITIMGA